MNFTPPLLKRALGLSFLILVVLWLYLADIDTFARTLNINNYSECPPRSDRIWVEISAAYSPTGAEIVRQIPFASGTEWYQEWIPNTQTPDPNDGEWRWIEYDNYLRGVLGGEVGIEGYFDEDALRAMAILARTKAYQRCGAFIVGGHRGILGQRVQEYRYHRVLDFNNPQIYQNAVNYGNNPYITYNNDTFDIQYRNKGGKWTEEMGGLPHIKIYDPPGERYYQNPTSPPIPWTGLMQENANIWAKGVGPDGYKFPPWDVPRLLAHSYGSIEFVGLNPNPPDDYRFNILRFGGWDDRANNPLILRTGETYPVSFVVQNTGDNSWNLSCYGSHPWHETALSFHWYSYPNKQYISPRIPYFETIRNRLCGSSLAPGKEYPSQENSSDTAIASLLVQALPGEYWLRLDMEFRNIKWGSRLDPNTNPNNAQWPTQDLRVQVISNIPPAPVPSISSGQTPGQWNNNNTVTLSWAAVNDPLLTHYRVCRDKRNDGQGSSCSNVSGTNYSRTLSDGIYDFEVTAVAGDGKNSDAAAVDNIRLDATDPTAELYPLPLRVQAPDYVLNWNSGDTGGAGFAAQQLTYQINNDNNWRSVPAVSSDLNMRSIRL